MLTYENETQSVNNAMSMTFNEKEATIEYVEFNLLQLCEQLEQHIDPDAVGAMYEMAYSTLNDIDQTLQGRVDQVALNHFYNNYHQR